MVPRFWMSHVSFVTKQSLACIPGPCGPKNASFCRNLLLCHFSTFSSLSPRLSLSSSPSFCQDITDICAFFSRKIRTTYVFLAVIWIIFGPGSYPICSPSPTCRPSPTLNVPWIRTTRPQNCRCFACVAQFSRTLT